jgi:two-component system phosphate regulon sensor histidine kinase PhoR
VELELDVAPGVPAIRRDERAIEIAVINLVDNALKYGADGGRVAVSVRRVKDQIEIRVADRGPGIKPEDKKRIFERFVRGTPAQGKQVRGSGIGLALVKHIAEAHGGRAWVEDGAERGSVFVLALDARGVPRSEQGGDSLESVATR